MGTGLKPCGWKPGVSRRVHFFIAPLLWTLIGCMLLVRGWLSLSPGPGRWLVGLGLILGTLKSRLVLDKMARRASERLQLFQDGVCLGAVFSWQSWLLASFMMSAGLLLRHLFQPGPVMGVLYCAIGWALCFSSRLGWRQWYNLERGDEIT